MRAVRFLLVVLLVFSVLFFGSLVHSRLWGKRFGRILPGVARSVVLQDVGEPSRAMRCNDLPEPPAGCKSVLVYAGPLAGLMPEFWLIPLDEQDRVLKVLHTTRAD